MYDRKEIERVIDRNIEACLLLTINGIIVYHNKIASQLFLIDSLIDVDARYLMPKEYSFVFPDEISKEHTSKNIYKQRIYVRGDGSVLPALMCCNHIFVNNIMYVIAFVKLNVLIQNDENLITRVLISQNINILQNEIAKEQNANKVLMDNRVKDRNDFINNTLAHKLSLISENLTHTDFVISSLIIQKFDASRIANLLNVSVHTVYSSKKRLKKRLNLSRKNDIYSFLSKL